jgi:hypothetical protein
MSARICSRLVGSDMLQCGGEYVLAGRKSEKVHLYGCGEEEECALGSVLVGVAYVGGCFFVCFVKAVSST